MQKNIVSNREDALCQMLIKQMVPELLSRRLPTSVARFGKTLLVWQKIKVFGNSCEGLIIIGRNREHSLANIYANGQTFH